MFPPFENVSEYRPGLIIWCAPNCELKSELPMIPFNRNKHVLRPYLIVAVDFDRSTIEVARLWDTVPFNTTRWVRISDPPPITWKVTDAWIWVGKPATVPILLNNSKLQHPHIDAFFSSPPVAEQNLRNYRIHRSNYNYLYQDSPTRHIHLGPEHSSSSHQGNDNLPWPPQNMRNAPHNIQLGHLNNGPGYPSPSPHGGPSSSMQPSSGMQPTPYIMNPGNGIYSTSGFGGLSHDIAMGAGFTETNPDRPGWLRNPESGWFWHASRGLFPPSYQPPAA